MITRVTRAAMLDILHEDYLRTARAKGVPESRVVLKHALRNASVPILTVVGLQLGQLIGGVVMTETIFSWPGLGLYAVTAVENQDYPASWPSRSSRRWCTSSSTWSWTCSIPC